jgi:hypothetical protein
VVEYQVVNFKERPDLYDLQNAICGRAFPEFLYYSQIADKYWERMIAYYKEYQLLILKDHEIVSVINCMPMNLDIPDEALPQEAFNWGIEKGIKDFEAGKKINAVMGVQIIIPKEYQGKGLSSTAVEALKNMCVNRGIKRLVIPIRPSLKSKYPINSMDNYIQWKNSDGLPFDPWLRVHVKNNAQIISVCKNAVEVAGTVNEWETWTKMKFPESGEYVVPGALCPVKIDLENNLGTYIEPNVWVSYGSL